MKTMTLFFAKVLTVVALFTAIASSGFAHHQSSFTVDDSTRAFLEAIGVEDDFCGDFGGDQNVSANICEACRLSFNALLADIDWTSLEFTQGDVEHLGCSNAADIVSSTFDLSKPTRGPPSI